MCTYAHITKNENELNDRRLQNQEGLCTCNHWYPSTFPSHTAKQVGNASEVQILNHLNLHCSLIRPYHRKYQGWDADTGLFSVVDCHSTSHRGHLLALPIPRKSSFALQNPCQKKLSCNKQNWKKRWPLMSLIFFDEHWCTMQQSAQPICKRTFASSSCAPYKCNFDIAWLACKTLRENTIKKNKVSEMLAAWQVWYLQE